MQFIPPDTSEVLPCVYLHSRMRDADWVVLLHRAIETQRIGPNITAVFAQQELSP